MIEPCQLPTNLKGKKEREPTVSEKGAKPKVGG
jgi:hypothetical protein